MDSKKIGREILLLSMHLSSFVYLFLIWETLPEMVPTHFNIEGEPDAWNNKQALIWILLGYHGFLYGLLLLIPVMATKKFQNTNRQIWIKLRIGLSVLFSGMAFILVYMSAGNAEVGIVALGVFFSILTAFIGNYIQAVKPNYLLGIRTPWTLASDEVWKKTHNLGGKVMFYLGLLSLPFVFIVPSNLAPFPSVGVLVLSAIFLIIYSFVLYKKLKPSEN